MWDTNSHPGRLQSRTRREFVQGAAALVTLAWAGAPVVAAASAPVLGVQLYTLRELLARNFSDTLGSIARIGYREVETAGLLNEDPQAFRAALDAAGLSAPSAHIFPNSAQHLLYRMATGQLDTSEAWRRIEAPMTLERLEDECIDMFRQAQVLGCRYLVLASMNPALFDTMAGIDRVCAAFQRAGKLCREHGLKFAWHPHLKDWGEINGKRAAEHVLDATDPERVFVELDFFWASMVNVDIPKFLRNYGGRVHLGHIKDFVESVTIPAAGFRDFPEVKREYFEDVGHGQLDYEAWIPLARQAGMRHFFVERDYSPDPLESARRSFIALRSLFRA